MDKPDLAGLLNIGFWRPLPDNIYAVVFSKLAYQAIGEALDAMRSSEGRDDYIYS